MGPVATQIFFRSLERLTFWFVGLGLSLLPALTAVKPTPSISVIDMLWKVNQAGFFRDVFFVALLLSAIGMTNLWDNIIRHHKPNRPGFRAVATLAFAYFLGALLYATYAFASMGPHQVIDHTAFNADILALTMVVAASAATEVLIVLNE